MATVVADSSLLPTDPGSNVLVRLRAGTRTVHASLDAALPHGLHDRPTLVRYLRTMLGLARWLAHLPAELPQDQRGWHDPRREALLMLDLQALDAPGALDLPPLPQRHEWFGGCYVMEGSALGGRLLLRQAETAARADPAIAGALRFLRHHTADPSRWRRFVAALDAVEAGRIDDVVRGARRGFALTHALLQQPEPSTA